MMYRGAPGRSTGTTRNTNALSKRGPPAQSIGSRVSERITDRFSVDTFVDAMLDRLLPSSKMTQGEQAREGLRSALTKLAPHVQKAQQEKDAAKAELDRCIRQKAPTQLALRRFQAAQGKMTALQKRIQTVNNTEATLETREIDDSISQSMLAATKYVYDLGQSSVTDEMFTAMMERQNEYYDDEIERTDLFGEAADLRDGANGGAQWDTLEDAASVDPEVAAMMQAIQQEQETADTEDAAKIDAELIGTRVVEYASQREPGPSAARRMAPARRQPAGVPNSWGDWDD